MSLRDIKEFITHGALRKCEEKIQEEVKRQKQTVDKS